MNEDHTVEEGPDVEGTALQQQVTHLRSDLAECREIADRLRVMENAVRSSVTAIAFADCESQLTYVNPAFLDLWGYESEGEIVGKEAVEVWQIEDQADEFREALETQGEWLGEIEGAFQSGRPCYVRLHASVVADEEGEPSFVMGTFVDVTERRQAQKQLAEAVAFTERFVEVAPVGISIYDGSGQCVNANRASARIVGATLEQVLAQNFREIESWKRTGLLEAALEALETGEPARKEIKVVTTFGREVWLDCHLVSATLGGEKRLMLIISDLTERVQAEEERRRSAISRSLVGQMLRDLQTEGELSALDMFHAGRDLAGRVGSTSLSDFLEAFGVMGLGTLALEKRGGSPERWTFSGHDLVGKDTQRAHPTDDYARGFLCGAVSAVLGGRRVAGVETECQSMGDEACVFIIQSMD